MGSFHNRALYRCPITLTLTVTCIAYICIHIGTLLISSCIVLSFPIPRLPLCPPLHADANAAHPVTRKSFANIVNMRHRPCGEKTSVKYDCFALHGTTWLRSFATGFELDAVLFCLTPAVTVACRNKHCDIEPFSKQRFSAHLKLRHHDARTNIMMMMIIVIILGLQFH